MDTTTSKSRYILTSLAIIIVITAFILVGLNALHLENRLASSSFGKASKVELNAKYVEGYLAARQKYQAMCPFASQPAYSLNGTVQSVNADGSITVTQNSLESDELVDHVSDQRWIIVTSNTIINRSVAKSQEQFQKETADFNSARAAGSATVAPPSPMSEELVRLGDIPVGSRVRVESDQDVRTLERFSATRISVILE